MNKQATGSIPNVANVVRAQEPWVSEPDVEQQLRVHADKVMLMAEELRIYTNQIQILAEDLVRVAPQPSRGLL